MNMRFALIEDRMVHVDQVDTGLKCNCVCPGCGEDLVAKNKGKIREHHFAHCSGKTCEHGYETMLHFLAKEAIAKHKRIRLPECSAIVDNRKTRFVIHESRIIDVYGVSLERRMDNIVSDVIAYTETKEPLLIEIKVTHAVDDEKLKKIQELNINTVEFDLSTMAADTEEDVLEYLLGDSRNSRWIHNKEAIEIGDKLRTFAESKQLIERGLATHVDDCPLDVGIWKGKSYANVTDDCLCCDYNLHGHDIDDCVLCLGKTKASDYESFRRIKEVVKKNHVVTRIVFENGNEEDFSTHQGEGADLVTLWKRQNETPFLASNIQTGVAVFITKNPVEQFNKYRRCYGQMYKNGYNIGSREIYGAFDDQWVLIEKK